LPPLQTATATTSTATLATPPQSQTQTSPALSITNPLAFDYRNKLNCLFAENETKLMKQFE